MPIDSNVNVYVGGDFTRTRGAESEGLLVVSGDARFPTSRDGDAYNIGVAGVGSRLSPPPMSDMLLVGGTLSVGGGVSLLVGHGIGGNVRVGGSISPDLKPSDGGQLQLSGGTLETGVGRAAALGEHAATGERLARISGNYADLPATGTAELAWGTLRLTGDGTSPRQVFELDGAALGTMDAIAFPGVPEDAVIILNVTGAVADVRLSSVLTPAGSVMDLANNPEDQAAFGNLTQRVLWNFTDARDVTVRGDAQFPGSVLVPAAGSKTTFAVPGMNGRVLVAGSLEQNREGSEIHAFPFVGERELSCVPDEPERETPASPVLPAVTQAVCAADGAVTAPVLTLAETAGISYTVAGEIAAGKTVTVTATAGKGHILSNAKGWSLSKDGSAASIEITFDAVDCEQPVTPVAPVTPTVTQAVCAADGSVSAPEVSLAETAGISYEVAGEIAAGKTVTVTATVTTGHAMAAATGWTLAKDGLTASTKISFDAVDCEPPVTPVAPVTPTVTQAVCAADGSASAPELTLAETAGISYEVAGEIAAGKTVTVTATAAKDHALSNAKGWTIAKDGLTARAEITFDTVDCEPPVTPVAPVTPTVTQAVCTADGSASAPELTLAETAGISYEVAGEIAAGKTVTVTATAGKGHILSNAKGWSLSKDGSAASIEITTDAVDCEQPVTPVAPVTPTVTQAACAADGSASAPEVSLAETAGVSYEVAGEIAAGESVTVTATAAAGTILAEIEGWERDASGLTATRVLAFDRVNCQRPGVPTETP
ncbi:choice-of-anchor A family protein, partial [Leucobacter sp. M11]|uniref:choice-of-anchor A family protein n=1 Tax=Leucobacter sp. M11 TaxID=2993565 RepID=UPI002D7F8B7C